MPFETLPDGKRLYYEVHGSSENPTIVMLSGIMMSCTSWYIFLDKLTRNLRVVLIDLRDQGKSSYESEQYDISLHVKDLEHLFNSLKFDKFHLYGISYGAQVAMLYTIEYPARVKSLLLFNAPPRTTPYIAQVGEAWKEAAKSYDGEKFFTLGIPYAYSYSFYNKSLPWLKERQKMFKQLLTREWFDGFIRLASTNEDFSVIGKLSEIKCPVLLVGSDKDMITPLDEMELIKKEIPQAEFLIIKDSGHASIIEKPEEFVTAVTGFVLKHK
ncbi:MAG TPA: alpha/beta hydrolase [Mesotoga infera]|nr:alpha/beta hydrolase [Mesotoga sp.]HON29348.1 alpha/beta hydrolase [Mesotoga infera]HPD38644.1 alpha/beta hydrolase [Mesotoga infera]HRR44843.1 alpha/beta hydrolase [Mesotoga sp.]HRV02230.1 alpha/beta hydrolase [Mesotoga sp.]